MNFERKSLILDGTRFNFSITPEQMVSALVKVHKYSFAEKIQRFDDIFAAQPAVLAAAVELPGLGVDLKTADHAFHVLLVLFECFSQHVPKLPKIATESVQKAFDEIASMLEFYDGEGVAEANRLHAIWTKAHTEHAVIAFVIGYLHSELKELTRDQELVRDCCLAMTNAYLAEYKAMQ